MPSATNPTPPFLGSPAAVSLRPLLRSTAMAETARALNPSIEIVVRTHNEAESQLLRSEGVGTVFFGEEELARNIAHHVVQRFAPRSQDAAVTHA